MQRPVNVIQDMICQKKDSVWLWINHEQSLFGMAAKQPAYLNIVKQQHGYGSTECLAAVPVAVTVNPTCSCFAAWRGPQLQSKRLWTKWTGGWDKKTKSSCRKKIKQARMRCNVHDGAPTYHPDVQNNPEMGECTYLTWQKNVLHLLLTHSLGLLFNTSHSSHVRGSRSRTPAARLVLSNTSLQFQRKLQLL